MIFKDKEKNDDRRVVSYGSYRPWSWHKMEGGDSMNYPAHSGRILDLKQSKPSAIRHFAELVDPDLGSDFAIAVVPSHDPEKADGGVARLAKALLSGTNRIDATGCLVRHEKIEKLAHGGDRSTSVHLNSIRVEHPDLIKSREVLLLDDVQSTGNSLMACRKLLLDAGATLVQCVALGRTG